MKKNMLQMGDNGEDVRAIQMALAGFDGGVFDGYFGPATRMQVRKFQRDFMRVHPTGKVDNEVIKNIIGFGKAYPLGKKIECGCGLCSGFGAGKNKGKYRSGMPKIEAYNQYEYPGLHKVIFWLVKAVMFYCRETYIIAVNSGYRCSEDNRIHGRKSTNHHGKACDLVITNSTKQTIHADTTHAKNIVGINCNIQIGWDKKNMKSLEPAHISRTWLHLDVRSFEKKYLKDEFFVKSEKQLYGFEGLLDDTTKK